MKLVTTLLAVLCLSTASLAQIKIIGEDFQQETKNSFIQIIILDDQKFITEVSSKTKESGVYASVYLPLNSNNLILTISKSGYSYMKETLQLINDKFYVTYSHYEARVGNRYVITDVSSLGKITQRSFIVDIPGPQFYYSNGGVRVFKNVRTPEIRESRIERILRDKETTLYLAKKEGKDASK